MNNCENTQRSKLLVEAIANGDSRSEEQFVIRYRASVLVMLINMTQDRARAEDLTHEALIIVLKKMRSNMIKDPKKLTSYMFQTARFCYFGWLRRVDNQVELGQQYDDIPGALLDADVEQLNRQRDEILHDSIDSLAVERDREILMRHYVHDQNKLEICDALLLTVESYDRVISRARLRLKTYVTRAGELAEYCTGMPGNTLGHAL